MEREGGEGGSEVWKVLEGEEGVDDVDIVVKYDCYYINVLY